MEVSNGSRPVTSGQIMVEITPTNFPRNHIIEFGGLPVVPFTITDHVEETLEYALNEKARLEGAASAPAPSVSPEAGNGSNLDDEDEGEGGEEEEKGDEEASRLATAIADPGSVAWWLEFDPDQTDSPDAFAAYLQRFSATVDTSVITALVIGGASVSATEGQHAVNALVARRDAFPSLRTLFIGEIDENQIMCFDETDITPLLTTYPDLIELRVCISSGLELSPVQHSSLRSLVLYCNSIQPDAIEAVAASELPSLEHLEFWSGDDFSESQDEDEAAALVKLAHSTTTLPSLRHLGLRDVVFIDNTLERIAEAPLLRQLTILDLSRSCLTDEGCQVLTASEAFRGLSTLVLSKPRRVSDLYSRMCDSLRETGVNVVIR